MLNKKYYLILLIITLIAFLPRSLQVFNPYNYFFDPEQGTEYLVTKSIVIDGQTVLTAHQGGFGGFSKGSGFNYLLAIPFIVGNGDPFVGRLFMLGISILTVSISFTLISRILNLWTAILISFLLAISLNLKDYAGGISPPFVIPFLTVIFIYYLFKALDGQKKFIPILFLNIGIMTHFEMATAGILFLLLTFTGLVLLIKKTIPYRYYFFSICLFALPILPILIFDINHNFTNMKGVVKMLEMSTPKNLFTYFSLLPDRISVFSWNFISTFSPNIIIWITAMILILFGIYYFSKDKTIGKNRQFTIYLILIPIFTFMILLIYPGNVTNQWWITHLTVIYCVLLGIFINYFWQKNKFKSLIIILIIALSIGFIKRTVFIFQTQFIFPPDNYIKEKNAIEYIFMDPETNSFGIIVLAKREQSNYDYLIWWLGNTKYKHQPYRSKKGLYYIIIEPNYFAMKNSSNTFNLMQSDILLESTKLSNGFLIEKRIAKK